MFKTKMRKGFTLVELIIVMVILGALAAIAIPKMAGSTEGATLASMKSDMRMAIATANQEYSKKLAYTALAAGDIPAGSTVGGGTNTIAITATNVTVTRPATGDCSGKTLTYTFSDSSYSPALSALTCN